MAEAADVLWDYRDSVAEKALRDAWALTDRELDDEGKIRGAERDAFATDALRTGLRSAVLAVAERHKPALVKELVALIDEKDDDSTASHNDPLLFGTGSLRARQLAQLALQLAPTDPARAAQLASGTLAYGMPYELQGIFQELDARAPDAAHDLFARSVAAFRADESQNVYDAVILASYLRFRPTAESDTALVKSLLDAALDRMTRLRVQQIANPTDETNTRSAVLSALDTLQPYFQLYDPERAGELAAFAQQLRPELPASEYDSASQHLASPDADPSAPENILSRAASEKNPDNRDALYLQAALHFANRQNYERAFDALLSARKTERRDQFQTFLYYRYAKRLAETKELNDASKSLEKINDPEMRSEATVVVAGSARRAKDTVLARYVLSQTVKLLEDRPASAPHARSYLWIASEYAVLDPPAGFELMLAAVRAVNAAPTIIAASPPRRMVGVGGNVGEGVFMGGDGADFRPGFRALALADYARAAQIADLFRNDLFRGLSVVSVASAVLKDRPRAQTDDADAAKPTQDN